MTKNYWCENCATLPLKTFDKVVHHLEDIHKIKIQRVDGRCAFRYPAGVYRRVCVVCGAEFKGQNNDKKAMEHLKVHGRFYIGENSFTTPFQVIKYLSEKYNIHICYEQGLVNRRVYLDGLLKDTGRLEVLMPQPIAQKVIDALERAGVHYIVTNKGLIIPALNVKEKSQNVP